MSIRGRVLHAFLTKLSPGALEQSQLLPPAPGDLVFVGDGLSTHGAWEEWFPSVSVRTFGDDALLIDDARQFVTNIDSPRALVILLGTADLLGFGGSTSPARAASRLDALVALAAERVDPNAIFVAGVPRRPALGARELDFNRRIDSLVSARGAMFVPAPQTASDQSEGYMLSALRWDASVYSSLGASLATAIGVERVPGRRAEPSAEPGKGFVAKVARKDVQLLETLPAPKGRVVLFGDSITAGGFWDAWLPDMPVANRGIGGDTVAQLVARIDSAIDSPRVVSVLVGTNDLRHGDDPNDPESIAQRFRGLIADIREREAMVPILINSVMPRAAKYSDTILRINDLYREIAVEFDAEYLDLWPILATPDRTLRKELTADGLHLNGAGYGEWVRVLRPAIERLNGAT